MKRKECKENDFAEDIIENIIGDYDD